MCPDFPSGNCSPGHDGTATLFRWESELGLIVGLLQHSIAVRTVGRYGTEVLQE